MKKNYLVVLFLLFTTFLYANEMQHQDPQLKHIKVQLQWKYQFQFAGFIMAKELGYYKDIGLDVELIEYSTGNFEDILKNSNVDYFLQNSALLYEKKKLLDVKLIATYFQRSPLILITQPEIESVEGLVGKNIMMGGNELYNNSLSILLDYYNVNALNSSFIKHSFNLQDFKDKKVDAISSFRTDQLFELMKDDIDLKIIDPAEYGFVTNANNLFVFQKKAKNDAVEIENFLSATKQGWEYALNHISEVAALIHNRYRDDKSIEALIYEGRTTKNLMLTNIYKIGEINHEHVDTIFKQLVRTHKIAKDENFAEYILENKDSTTLFTKEETNFIREKKSLTVCVAPAWKPIEWIDEKGIYKGMGADYLKLLSKIVDLDILIHKTDTWAESLAAIKAKQCDLIPMASITASRKEFLNFTDIYYDAPYVIATTTDKRFIEDISQQLDKTYAAVKDSAVIEDLKNLYPSIKILEVKTISEGLHLVAESKVFGLIDITTTISYLMQEEDLVNIKIAGKLPIGFKIAIASRGDEPLLQSVFQKAMNSLDKEDKEAIKNKWLSLIVQKKVDYDLLYKVLAFFTLVLMAFFYRQLLLKRHNDSLTERVETKTSELRKLNSQLEEKVKERTEQLEYQALYDSLTKLPNRAMFHERLSQALSKANQTQKSIALFFIDLDRFKQINDSLGHHIGDEVLKIVTKRLRSVIRKEDTLSRLGGDEFTLILDSLEDSQDAAVQANKILKILEEPIEVEGHKLYVSTSIGISIYPNDDINVHNLLKNADAAMYRAKEEGRNNFQFYSSDMTEVAFKKVMLQGSLRTAIDNEQFVVFYQPQVDAVEKKIIGLEALVRWDHPTEGLVPPSRFIPLAEETGLIVEIDQLVMTQAMKQVSLWHKNGLFDGTLSLNLAAKQLAHKNCLSVLKSKLEEYDFDASWLELEITESDIMKRPEEAIMKLQKIHSLGIKISIDDFGTGYSSLSYLKRFPIDKLKIDRSFVQGLPEDEEDSAIVKAVIALGNSLGLTLIAEGVETQEQCDFMIENSCRNIQGFLYAQPMNVNDTQEYFKSFAKSV